MISFLGMGESPLLGLSLKIGHSRNTISTYIKNGRHEEKKDRPHVFRPVCTSILLETILIKQEEELKSHRDTIWLIKTQLGENFLQGGSKDLVQDGFFRPVFPAKGTIPTDVSHLFRAN